MVAVRQVSIPKEHRDILLARAWVGKVSRKICKRPVMTLPYGATQSGMREQIMEVLTKHQEETGESLLSCDPWAASVFLSSVVYRAIGEVVIAARGAMNWLQDTARLISKSGKPIRWTTPAGFPVKQAYKKYATKIINTLFGGVRIQTHYLVEQPELDNRKQASGIAPNFVHSMDSSHLMLTVNRLRDRGVSSFAMVHDSYGTHAADATEMSITLREVFVDMYQENVLKSFLENVVGLVKDPAELPEMPPMGDLDLEEVKESLYFFA